LKPVKALNRHLPGNTLAKDISDALLALGFSVIYVRKMSGTRHKAEVLLEAYSISFFLVTLTSNEKASEIF
jgi:hypothetical protein